MIITTSTPLSVLELINKINFMIYERYTFWFLVNDILYVLRILVGDWSSINVISSSLLSMCLLLVFSLILFMTFSRDLFHRTFKFPCT